jgi:hypothetical protein
VTARLTIAERFNGPPASGNGGYVCGLIAQLGVTPASTAMTVTLRQPPPLGQPLDVVTSTNDVTELRHGDELVAEAIPAADVPPLLEIAASPAVAAAERVFRGRVGHPFPTCFVCGPQRVEGDGLRLQPGPVVGRVDTTACHWIPDASLADAGSSRVRPEFAWAALDCPGAWTLDVVGRPMVLGRMTGLVEATPQVGDRCTVMGQLLRREGRRAFTATTLYDSDGSVLGRARATWVEIDPRTFGAGTTARRPPESRRGGTKSR